jgi:Kinesin motor domain
MLGEARQSGLVAMSLKHLFALIADNSERMYLLKLSMLEIYNEIINDLLEPGSTNLVLREDPHRGGVLVEGAKNVEVRSGTVCGVGERLMQPAASPILTAYGGAGVVCRTCPVTSCNRGCSKEGIHDKSQQRVVSFAYPLQSQHRVLQF